MQVLIVSLRISENVKGKISRIQPVPMIFTNSFPSDSLPNMKPLLDGLKS
jgi:hypothetical protein